MQVNTTYEPFSEEPEYIAANKDFIQTLADVPVKRVLDLACGTGLLTQSLLENRSGVAVTGIDLDPEQIGIATKHFSKVGLLAQTPEELAAAEKEGRNAVFLKVGSAADLSIVEGGSIDLVMIGNAIHLMPDKNQFLSEVSRVLRSGGRFAFNSVFFVGTFSKEGETLFAEWMKEAVLYLNEKNAALRREGKPLIPRKRGQAGIAFDKDWMSGEEWEKLLATHNLKTISNSKREVKISCQGLQAVGAYGGLSEVLMSGYPVEVASECLQEGARRVFDKLNLPHIPRYWLEVVAVRA